MSFPVRSPSPVLSMNNAHQATKPYPPIITEPDEYFCLSASAISAPFLTTNFKLTLTACHPACGQFSHVDEAVVRAHHQQCSNKRVWRCKACYQEFLDYRDAEEHVWEHWRRIEDEKRQREEEALRRRQNDEVIHHEMQERARALLRDAQPRSG